jgi:hypothetical protein
MLLNPYYYNKDDNLSENPQLLRTIIYQIEKESDRKYKQSVETNMCFNSFEEEYEYISKMQKEVYLTSNAKTDSELQYYKRYYRENKIDRNDKIEVIYWEKEYSYFVKYVKRYNMNNMIDLFNYDFDKLYGTKGFNYIIIDRIIETFKLWCNEVIKLAETTRKIENCSTKEQNINDILNEFYK